MRSRLLICLLAAAGVVAALTTPAAAHPFPGVIRLPDGWQGEGIAVGTGPAVYAGSVTTGAVWRGDLRTGKGAVLVEPRTGRKAAGMKVSRGLLFVAGADTGQAYVYNARTGAQVATYRLGTQPDTFVNDVTVTRNAAWFTDSFRAVLYRLPLCHGRPAGEPAEVPLTGDWTQVAGAGVFNANGIAATPNGRTLLVVNSTVGKVYRINAATGVAAVVETTADLTAGDGILLRGRVLYVVRNQFEEIAVLRLSAHLRSARLVATLTDPDFEVPTTIAAFRGRLYAVNARFGLPTGTSTIVRVDGR